MANQLYDNYVLQNEVDNMYATLLGMEQFCTVDTSLTAQAGDKVKYHIYNATDGAEEVEMGVGNTKEINTTMSEKEFTVKTVQTRFPWFDEEARRDPLVPVVGSQKVAIDLVNKMNKDIIAAMHTATLYQKSSANSYNDFIDAVSKLTLDPLHAGNGDEALDPTSLCFALVNKGMVATIRKSMQDLLKYVEPYARTGYVGTVAGVNIYVSNLVKDDEVIIGHKSGTKLITKKSVALEPDREVNIRKNWLYGTQVYVPVLYDNTKVCIINKTGAKEE